MPVASSMSCAESPSVGIDRDVVVYEQIVELEAIGFLKHSFEKFPRHFELDRVFEQLGDFVAMRDLQHVETKLGFKMRRWRVRVGRAGAVFWASSG